MSKKYVFRVIFVQNDTLYEVYAKHVSESDMFGFIVIEELLFGEKSALVVDPTEERLKATFNEVKRTYVPMHSVIRIDEVAKEGHAKISPLPTSGTSNVSPFTPNFISTSRDSDSKK